MNISYYRAMSAAELKRKIKAFKELGEVEPTVTVHGSIENKNGDIGFYDDGVEMVGIKGAFVLLKINNCQVGQYKPETLQDGWFHFEGMC